MITPEERRGALMVAGLVLLGTLWDVTARWRAGDAASPRTTAGERASSAGPPAAMSGEVASDTVERFPRNPTATAAAGAAPMLDLNRASASELDLLPGIGPVLARRILEYRARFGPFQSVEELRAVRGVGPRMIARLAGRVRAGP